MTTNNPQAEYSEQPKREPQLSDEEAYKMRDATWLSGFDSWDDPMNATRDFYERRIDEGRLKVMEEVHDVESPGYIFSCSKCGGWIESGTYELNFCPGCGNPIKR